MKKSDLKTGMVVQLRNEKRYMVLLGTGIGGKCENVLRGNNGCWMPLCEYNEQMLCAPDHENDDFILDNFDDAKIDRMYDIMKVYAACQPCDIGSVKDCTLVYDRGEKEVS